MTVADEMLSYIRRIRNTNKKDYATRYAIWLCRDPEDHKTIVEPQSFHLSYMGAQAVRMALHAIADRSKQA